MAIDFSGVSAYVNETKNELISAAVLGSPTIKLLTLQTGVKSAETLNILTETVQFGDGTVCGFSDSGSTAISQRKLEVGAIKINKSYCQAELEKYFTQMMITNTAGKRSN